MAEPALLHCPIRGQLQVSQRAKDSLTFTEEKQRIDAIRFLLQRKYPSEYFGIETTLLRFGHKGRSSFRVDFSVYDTPFEEMTGLPIEERLDAIKLVAEIKRDNASATEAKVPATACTRDAIGNLAAGVFRLRSSAIPTKWMPQNCGTACSQPFSGNSEKPSH